MTFVPGVRGAVEEEAILADRYLESLLEAAERHARDVPVDPALDPALRATVRRLRDELVRVHPSFRFEEGLGRRLAKAAGQGRPAAAAGAEAAVVPFPVAAELAEAGAIQGIGAGAAEARPWSAVARPLVIGGALTSAAISIAGAAYVAWRATHGLRRLA